MVTERESVFVSWVVTSLLFLLISGIIWPRYDMPVVWRWLSAIFPSTWGVEGFVKMNTDGSRLWQVGSEYINLWILAVVWWIAGWCAQKWVVHPEIRRHELQRAVVVAQIKAQRTERDETEVQG